MQYIRCNWRKRKTQRQQEITSKCCFGILRLNDYVGIHCNSKFLWIIRDLLSIEQNCLQMNIYKLISIASPLITESVTHSLTPSHSLSRNFFVCILHLFFSSTNNSSHGPNWCKEKKKTFFFMQTAVDLCIF